MDMVRAKRLIELMETKGLSELELEEEDFKIKLTKSITSRTEQRIGNNSPLSSLSQPSSEEKRDEFMELISPLVGFFYRSSSPKAQAYVKAGERINAGQIVCAIEVMGTMHEVPSKVKGEIAGIMVKDGQAVEYGQVLFLIKP